MKEQTLHPKLPVIISKYKGLLPPKKKPTNYMVHQYECWNITTFWSWITYEYSFYSELVLTTYSINRCGEYLGQTNIDLKHFCLEKKYFSIWAVTGLDVITHENLQHKTRRRLQFAIKVLTTQFQSECKFFQV